jgi:hypothetical protein
MYTGQRHEGGEAGEEVEGFEDDRRRAVAIRGLQRIANVAGGRQCQAFDGDCGTRNVAHEMLELRAFAAVDRDARMQRETRGAREAVLGGGLFARRQCLQLTQAEAAFRIHKDQLRIRPIWHQRADRVQAHILVCFLAFVLWKTLELWQSRAGLGNSPRTLLEELARIQSQDVILPTQTHGDIRLRCVTQPDAAQAALLERLGVVLPKRLRLPEIDLPVVLSA